jgi:superfamily II DNA or RNA helicase
MATGPEIQTKILTRGTSPDQYRLYRAALEWDLTEPIVIQNADDLKSKQRWRDRVTPFHHQVTNLITFCRRLPVTLLADDVGLGKTISAGLIMSELIARARLSKVLIVCPKLLGPQWKDELQSKFGIEAEIAIGRNLLNAEPEETGAVITTYNSARMYLDAIPQDRFQMLVLDEAHKLRNLYGTESPPKVATTFRQALEKRRFRFVLMLTATPIQNRLWDLYSLVDLLTVARGHENPFGSTGAFARKFIADKKDQARQLKIEAKDDFRSIIYGYMSRVRRGDAKLYFPDRVVQMHRVKPTRAELELIAAIAKPIQLLNRLAQISILQALTSSPDALSAQLANMARNGTVPALLALTVKEIVEHMPISAKLTGLEALIGKLKKENPERWRLVVFTTRRETQTTIQAFLESHDLKVGLINGESGARNQETINRFRQDPPLYRVIVSTEAGSEGVNLQVANVLVNYDLPWNPMIVEQRIGRVQRLASEHAHVSIFNIMLQGTFEEYIVGRLMEKLQMASHAIGDIESLLQGSDVGDGEDDAATNFEDQILGLVLAALTGKNVEQETRLKAESIEKARAELERSEATINEMLGSSDGTEYTGPRAPKLPVSTHSMGGQEFALSALRDLGVRVTPHPGDDIYIAEENGSREYIRFKQSAPAGLKSTLYAPGSNGFSGLVRRVTASGIHDVSDRDSELELKNETAVRHWLETFGGRQRSLVIDGVRRRFEGKALLRVRVTTAHDSYERLVEVDCIPASGSAENRRFEQAPLAKTLEDPFSVGLDKGQLIETAKNDESVAEFCRFYLERREQEVLGASNDERKKQKLFDDFTPRFQFELVGLQGAVCREVRSTVKYSVDDSPAYESNINSVPSTGQIEEEPERRTCSVTQHSFPADCLARCEISGATALRHLLVESGISGRLSLPEHTVTCSISGKRVLTDESELSSITQNPCAIKLLKTSAVSARRGEPEYFRRCSFTGSDVLAEELATSELSGRSFRRDEQARSSVSDKMGHRSEFVECSETRLPIAVVEAEKCEVTGRLVRPSVLEVCQKTGKHVVPSELSNCMVTGQRALKSLYETSSISNLPLLKEVSIQSIAGRFCAPTEAQICVWSGKKHHPDDIRICAITGVRISWEFSTEDGIACLRPLRELLEGMRRTEDGKAVWDKASQRLSTHQGGRIRVESAVTSVDGDHLALCCESKTLFGLRTAHLGALYDLRDGTILGKIAVGKRENNFWVAKR